MVRRPTLLRALVVRRRTPASLAIATPMRTADTGRRQRARTHQATPLLVTIDSLTPGEIPEQGPIQVRGTRHQPRRRDLVGDQPLPVHLAAPRCQSRADLTEAAALPSRRVRRRPDPRGRAPASTSCSPGRPRRSRSPCRARCSTPTSRRARRVLVRRARARGQRRRCRATSSPTAARAPSCRYVPPRTQGRRCGTALVVPLRRFLGHERGRLARPTRRPGSARSSADGRLRRAGRVRRRRRRPAGHLAGRPGGARRRHAGSPTATRRASSGSDRARSPSPASPRRRRRPSDRRERGGRGGPRARRPREQETAATLADRLEQVLRARRCSPCRTATSTSPAPPITTPALYRAGRHAGQHDAGRVGPHRPRRWSPRRAATSTPAAIDGIDDDGTGAAHRPDVRRATPPASPSLDGTQAGRRRPAAPPTGGPGTGRPAGRRSRSGSGSSARRRSGCSSPAGATRWSWWCPPDSTSLGAEDVLRRPRRRLARPHHRLTDADRAQRPRGRPDDLIYPARPGHARARRWRRSRRPTA